MCVCVRERERERDRERQRETERDRERQRQRQREREGEESILPPSSASGGLPDEVERTIYWGPRQALSDPWLATSPVHEAGGKIPPQGRGVIVQVSLVP